MFKLIASHRFHKCYCQSGRHRRNDKDKTDLWPFYFLNIYEKQTAHVDETTLVLSKHGHRQSRASEKSRDCRCVRVRAYVCAIIQFRKPSVLCLLNWIMVNTHFWLCTMQKVIKIVRERWATLSSWLCDWTLFWSGSKVLCGFVSRHIPNAEVIYICPLCPSDTPLLSHMSPS